MGENCAGVYLERRGLKILERNWRFGRLELDLICAEDECIVFVEVKSRRSADFGGPLAAVTDAKQKLLCLAASAWLSANQAWGRPCRFDVLCLLGTGENFQLEHYPNAFEFRTALDNCHSAWQPW